MDTPDLSVLRSRFPALSRQLDGRTCVFADAPGGSQVPDTVLDAMRSYLIGSNANTHGTFVTSRETDALIAQARRAGADLLNADPSEIVFGPNSTSLLFDVSRSIARTLGPGDEVVVTRLDHDGNIRPWVMAAEDAGATIRWVDLRDDDVTLDLDSFDAALSERTKVVAFTLASNAVGTITPAADLVRLARRTPALVCVDGVQFAPHRSFDVRAIGADLAVCSPYKFFGPHLGVLWARRELLEAWIPYKVRPAPDEVPDRWETGTANHEGLAGFIATVDYLAQIGDTFPQATEQGDRGSRIRSAFRAIGAYERSLSQRFLTGLSQMDHVALYGIADQARVGERVPTFAVRVGDQLPIETTERLGARGVFTWDGHYYAIELMERLGLWPVLGGCVRIGLCHYTTTDEVDRILAELELLA